MSIATETAACLERAGALVDFPRIARVALPNAPTNPCQDAEFGLVILTDGSTGPFYVWLDRTLDALGGVDLTALEGTAPADWLGYTEHRRIEHRALALGIMNAMSQSLFRRAGLVLSGSSSFGGLRFAPGDRIGMVGLFPSLARRLHRDGVDFVVIERKRSLATAAHPFEVTLDAGRLAHCNKVLITGSTLLNESLGEVLAECRPAERVVIIGPTASCVPDAVFASGAHAMGGSSVVELEALLERRRAGEPWGDSVHKYLLEATDYPGVEALSAAAALKDACPDP